MDQGIETEGSNLSGVSAKCVWDDLSRPPDDEEDSRSICIGSQPRRLSEKGVSSLRGPEEHRESPGVPEYYKAALISCFSRCRMVQVHGLVCVLTDTEQIRETLRKGLEFNTKAALPPINSQRQSQERPQ